MENRALRVEWKPATEYVLAPVGAAVRSGTVAAVWCATPAIRFIRLWGRPGRADLALVPMVLQADIEPDAPPHASVIDVRKLKGVGDDAFEAVAAWIGVHRDALESRFPRLSAVVHTDSKSRLLFAGFEAVAGLSAVSRAFVDGVDALAWLGVEAAASRWAEWEAFISTELEGGISSRVRQYVSANLSSAHVDQCASSLNTSPRSLQRMLTAENVSFREIILEARVERAKRLLARGDAKLLAAALEVGFSRVEQLNDAFVRIEGCSAAEWRRRAKP